MLRHMPGGISLAALALFAATLSAQDAPSYGDFAPRDTLVYARVSNGAQALEKLQGEAWRDQVNALLRLRPAHVRADSDPLVNEVLRIATHARAIEFALVDVMVREPFAQMIVAAHLASGAPAEFNQKLQEWVKEMDGTATADSVDMEGVLKARLAPGMLILSVGGAAHAHVADVLDGDKSESISSVERFQRWSERARADIDLWADFRNLRRAIDKLGEDGRAGRELNMIMRVLEWQNWDQLTAALSLPGPRSPLALTVDLSFSPPAEGLNAILRPAGASRLAARLPEETMAFGSAQLGNDAEKSWRDLLVWMHDIEASSRLQRDAETLEYYRAELQSLEERLKQLEDPKSNVPAEAREAEAKVLRSRIEQFRQMVTRTKQNVRAGTPPPFHDNAESRGRRGTGPEQAWDGVNELLARVGLTRAEAATAIGSEITAGWVALPDNSPDALDAMFDALWFAMLELQPGHLAVRERILDWALARNLAEDATEEERQEARRRAESMMFKKVEGGEILAERGLFSEFCVFFGDGFVGVTENEDVALRILRSAQGERPFSPARLPAGSAGSKLAYVNLGELLARTMEERRYTEQRRLSSPFPWLDLRRMLLSGLHVSAATDESASRIGLTLRSSAEVVPVDLASRLAKQVEAQFAWEHDRNELEALADAARAWHARNAESLAAMTPDDRAAAIAAVTLPALVEAQILHPDDGLRSAFDPALAARVEAMFEAGADTIGGEEGIAECGFQWHGLPSHEFLSDIGARDKLWLLASSSGAWVDGGRIALACTGGTRFRVVHLTEAAWRAVTATNRGGAAATAPGSEPPALPLWRAKREFRRQRYVLEMPLGFIATARAKATEEGRELRWTFHGPSEANPGEKLRELLGLGEDSRVWIPAERLEIEVNGPNVRIRMAVGEHWIEVNQDRVFKSSWE